MDGVDSGMRGERRDETGAGNDRWRGGEGGTRETGQRAEDLAAELAKSYVTVQYAFVQFLTEHLVESAAAFDQDLTAMLVLAVLGQRRLEANMLGQGVDGIDPARSAMSASRIADVTGVPRQTVRRKLDRLRARGWVGFDPVQGWFIAGAADNTPVRDAMRELEARFFLRLARLHLGLARALQQPRPDPGSGE